MIYNFIAKSQCYFNVYANGVMQRIKFSILYEGSSHYTTHNKAVADAIRHCDFFRKGIIRELPPTEEVRQEPTETAVQPTIELEAPKYVMRLKAGKRTVKLEAPERKVEVEDEAPTQTNASNAITQEDEEGVTGVQLEGVKSFMEAKMYLRNVLHASQQDVSTKAKVQNYCEDHGVSFPNFEF